MSLASSNIKKQLRAEALARRDALDPVFRAEVALQLGYANNLLEIEQGTIVSGFWPMRSELDLRPLMFRLIDGGMRVCLPAILDKTTIVFRELKRGTPLVDMGFGTRGPGEDAAIIEPSVMLIPLAAFDARGHRIGYGAGYYDRAIARLHGNGLSPRLVAAGFDCQQVPRVPEASHDVQLHQLLSDTGLRTFPLTPRPPAYAPISAFQAS